MLLCAGILVLLAGAYLFCLCPNRGRQEEMRPFEAVCIAHRGLHDNPAVPENSLAAFRRAAEAGYGIELDVQLTADDRLVVFHDETLARVCGDSRKLHEMTWEELSALPLFGTEERVPLFSEVLALVGGAVPLIVEIKSEGRWPETTRRTLEALADYPGVYCIESFHPMVLRQVRRARPDILRGQLSTDYRREGVRRPGYQRFLLTNLLLDRFSRPDFIAYNCLYRSQPSFALCRRLFRPVPVAWTVRSQAELDTIRPIYRIFIFEGFRPEAPAPEQRGETP